MRRIRRILLAWTAVLLCFGPLRAETVVLEVNRDGVYKVTHRMLAPFLGEADPGSAALGLTHGGVPVPILVRDGGDGVFGPGDHFIFIGTRNPSPYTQTSVYTLTTRAGGAVMAEEDAPAPSPDQALSTARIVHRWERDLRPRSSMDRAEWEAYESPSWTAGPIYSRAADFYRTCDPEDDMGQRLRDRFVQTLSLPAPPEDPASGLVRVRLVKDDANPTRFAFLLGDAESEPMEWGRSRAATFEFRLGPGFALEPDGRARLGIQCLLQFCPEMDLDWYEMETRVRAEALEGRLRLPGGGRDMTVGGFTGPDILVFELTRGAAVRGVEVLESDGGYAVAFHAEEGREYMVVGAEALERPMGIHGPGRFEYDNPPDAEVDYLIIARPELFEGARRLADYRAGRGRSVKLVDVRRVFDRENHGEFSPLAVQSYIRRQAAAGPLAFVLLIGDAVADVDFGGYERVIPAFRTLEHTGNLIGSDNPYADLNGDGLPELALGRIPARTPAQLAAVVDKIIEYETDPPPGPWRRRLVFTASEADFGPWIDKIIEDNVKRILGALIGPEYDAEMTYSNPGLPYLWIPEDFRFHVVDRINRGALLFNYIGHGGVTGLDSVRWRGRRYRMFDEADLPALDHGGRYPIVLIIACHTGAFDAHNRAESFTESLLLAPNGAVAAIGSSVISQPMANAVLEVEFLKAFLDRGNPTIGEILLRAKQGLAGEPGPVRAEIANAAKVFMSPDLQRKELMDHILMYNLMGDPAMIVAFPEHRIELEARVSGDAVLVRGRAPGLGAGTAEVTLEYDRVVILDEIEPVTESDIEYPEKIASNWRKANDKVLFRAEAAVEQGGFEVSLPLPPGLEPGLGLHAKAYVTAEGGDALGAAAVDQGGGSAGTYD